MSLVAHASFRLSNSDEEVIVVSDNIDDLFSMGESKRNVATSAPMPIQSGSSVVHNESALIVTEDLLRIVVDPISLEIMIDPVLAGDHYTYDRSSITKWLTMKGASPNPHGYIRLPKVPSPCTGKDLPNHNLTPNVAVKNLVQLIVSSLQKQEQEGRIPLPEYHDDLLRDYLLRLEAVKQAKRRAANMKKLYGAHCCPSNHPMSLIRCNNLPASYQQNGRLVESVNCSSCEHSRIAEINWYFHCSHCSYDMCANCIANHRSHGGSNPSSPQHQASLASRPAWSGFFGGRHNSIASGSSATSSVAAGIAAALWTTGSQSTDTAAAGAAAGSSASQNDALFYDYPVKSVNNAVNPATAAATRLLRRCFSLRNPATSTTQSSSSWLSATTTTAAVSASAVSAAVSRPPTAASDSATPMQTISSLVTPSLSSSSATAADDRALSQPMSSDTSTNVHSVTDNTAAVTTTSMTTSEAAETVGALTAAAADSDVALLSRINSKNVVLSDALGAAIAAAVDAAVSNLPSSSSSSSSEDEEEEGRRDAKRQRNRNLLSNVANNPRGGGGGLQRKTASLNLSRLHRGNNNTDQQPTAGHIGIPPPQASSAATMTPHRSDNALLMMRGTAGRHPQQHHRSLRISTEAALFTPILPAAAATSLPASGSAHHPQNPFFPSSSFVDGVIDWPDATVAMMEKEARQRQGGRRRRNNNNNNNSSSNHHQHHHGNTNEPVLLVPSPRSATTAVAVVASTSPSAGFGANKTNSTITTTTASASSLLLLTETNATAFSIPHSPSATTTNAITTTNATITVDSASTTTTTTTTTTAEANPSITAVSSSTATAIGSSVLHRAHTMASMPPPSSSSATAAVSTAGSMTPRSMMRLLGTKPSQPTVSTANSGGGGDIGKKPSSFVRHLSGWLLTRSTSPRSSSTAVEEGQNSSMSAAAVAPAAAVSSSLSPSSSSKASSAKSLLSPAFGATNMMGLPSTSSHTSPIIHTTTAVPAAASSMNTGNSSGDMSVSSMAVPSGTKGNNTTTNTTTNKGMRLLPPVRVFSNNNHHHHHRRFFGPADTNGNDAK